ncbi:type VII secretion protein EccE [Mycobacterium stomatepiae]|uniref:Type VII secretion protein EccE n=1 Tax=Mycobacterium stomatepiae TaxID=470076 RepID=A0A7I7Q2F7_9MYCO|nr:type VII secretion protein EccE [Mycobacterium stomatepiae]MCV7165181.1 type VII secretion protein EccE [Mycobacterium stomatepiae]BBY20590.1 type VII secretion protein EccE [Mycobacterium stomatepiae]
MKAQRRFGLSLSWARVTVVFLVVVGILLIASHCPDSWQGQYHIAWWVGVGISAIIVLLSLVTHHGLTVTSGLAGWLWDWSADPGTTLAAGCTPALDYQRRFGRDKVGVREYDGRLVTVIALDGDDDTASRHHRQKSAPPASLLVRSVATGLRQFDVNLDGIDIVSVQMRRGGNAAELSKLDKLGPEEWGVVSDQPASYVRRTWLVLRMNPQSNVAAVAARDSLASTLVAATERLVQDLDAPGCAPRPLTSEEIAEVDSAVLADLEPTWSRPGWRYLKHFNGFATSFWLTPSDITTETLEELWLPDAEATVVTIQVTADEGQPQVSGWVRYHSDSRLPRGVSSGLNRLTGRQLAAVRASLPAPTTRPLLVVPTRGLLADDDLVLQVGQVREGAERLLAEQ